MEREDRVKYLADKIIGYSEDKVISSEWRAYCYYCAKFYLVHPPKDRERLSFDTRTMCPGCMELLIGYLHAHEVAKEEEAKERFEAGVVLQSEHQ